MILHDNALRNLSRSANSNWRVLQPHVQYSGWKMRRTRVNSAALDREHARGICPPRPSAARGLLAIGEMHRAVAAGRMRREFGGDEIVGRRCRLWRGRHRFAHAAIL